MNFASLVLLFINLLPCLIKNNSHLLFSKKKNFLAKVLSDCFLTLSLAAFKFRHLVFAVKFLFLLIFCLFSFSFFFNGSSRELCNEAWNYVIQLVVWLCDEFLKLKHLFLIISSFAWQLIKKCRRARVGISYANAHWRASLCCLFNEYHWLQLTQCSLYEEIMYIFFIRINLVSDSARKFPLQ